jgi:hypothetical protein
MDDELSRKTIEASSVVASQRRQITLCSIQLEKRKEGSENFKTENLIFVI